MNGATSAAAAQADRPHTPGRRLLDAEGATWLAIVGGMLVATGVVLRSTGLDTAWMLRVHADAPSAWGVVAWSCLTVLGLGWSVIAILLALDRGPGQGRIAALLVPTLVVAALLARVPKSLLAKPRPAGTDIAPQLHVIGHAFTGKVSMPSGHAVAAGALLALLFVMLPRRRWLAAGIPVALACLAISLSRVVVGAHWPSDVFVGTGLGLISVSFVLAPRWPLQIPPPVASQIPPGRTGCIMSRASC